MRKNNGFTLVEVMICAGILVGLFVGLISIYLYCFDLQETARNTSLALNAARARIEQIKTADFDDIEDFNGQIVQLAEPVGVLRIGAEDVTGSNNNLIDIRVVACWRQKGGRIVGTAALDGNGNFTDCTDSPVELNTAISRKE